MLSGHVCQSAKHVLHLPDRWKISTPFNIVSLSNPQKDSFVKSWLFKTISKQYTTFWELLMFLILSPARTPCKEILSAAISWWRDNQSQLRSSFDAKMYSFQAMTILAVFQHQYILEINEIKCEHLCYIKGTKKRFVGTWQQCLSYYHALSWNKSLLWMNSLSIVPFACLCCFIDE